MLRSLGAICGTGVPAVLQHLDVVDQLMNTSPLMPRGRGSVEVQQQEVKKLRCERYTQPGNQRREPLVAFSLVSHLLPLHQLAYGPIIELYHTKAAASQQLSMCIESVASS